MKLKYLFFMLVVFLMVACTPNVVADTPEATSPASTLKSSNSATPTEVPDTATPSPTLTLTPEPTPTEIAIFDFPVCGYDSIPTGWELTEQGDWAVRFCEANVAFYPDSHWLIGMNTTFDFYGREKEFVPFAVTEGGTTLYINGEEFCDIGLPAVEHPGESVACSAVIQFTKGLHAEQLYLDGDVLPMDAYLSWASGKPSELVYLDDEVMAYSYRWFFPLDLIVEMHGCFEQTFEVEYSWVDQVVTGGEVLIPDYFFDNPVYSFYVTIDASDYLTDFEISGKNVAVSPSLFAPEGNQHDYELFASTIFAGCDICYGDWPGCIRNLTEFTRP